MTTESAEARHTPCASCPYRAGVPSGIWHEEEYVKLKRYDAPMAEQPIAVFMCHQGSGDVCAGWLGHRDATDLLAVRIGIASGALSPACADYTTSVELFPSGAAASAHGRRDIASPSETAIASIRKIITVRASAGNPVTTDAGNEQ